jgi:hypothetical protein
MLLDETPVNILEKEIKNYQSFIKKLENRQDINSDTPQVKIDDIIYKCYKKIKEYESAITILNKKDVIKWVKFNFFNMDNRPQKYGKYLICRKDGKIHWETWNGSGWAYNHNEIIYFAIIESPITQNEK